jgi:uncharacterized protein YjdB
VKKLRSLFSGLLAVLAVLLLTGCWEKDNPVRTSLDVDTSTLTLSVGETAVRMAFSKAEDATITYTSSNPAVATVDQFGKVTAMSEGTATITIDMAETKKSWYAAKTLTYSVVVKNVSAQALANVDKATPLTLVAQADGKITVTFNNGITLANDIKYTINNGAEQTIAKNTTGSFDITVKKGDVVQLYSLNTSLGGGAVAGARGGTRAVDSGAKYINIRPSMKTEIYGNVMSLLKGKDNLEGATAIEAPNAFYGLFAGAEKLVNNTDRLLVLPATTLKEGCYDNMFTGCKGIEKAPVLPAPKLEKGCYQEMFFDCSKLNHVKCLASDISAEGSTKGWLSKAGTEATGEKVLETVVPMPSGSDDGVPDGWTVHKIVPVTGIKLDANEMTLGVGDVGTLKATLAPENTTEKTITWTSSSPAIASVDDNGNVTGVAEGTATITAQAGDKTATCVVTVTDDLMLAIPLTLEVTTPGTIIVKFPKEGMQYSLNGGAKTAVPDDTAIGGDLSVGDKVAFYGKGTDIKTYNQTCIRGGTAKVKVYGNIMSLVDEKGFATNKTLTNDFTFTDLFNGYTNLTDASGLRLPAKTLTDDCYQRMFYGCTALTTAPELPAKTLAGYCYQAMFSGCTALTTAPELPAKTLTLECYSAMFCDCTSLTTAPKLPATTLANNCYDAMFYDCTSLTTAPKLPATTLIHQCYKDMFHGCTALTTAYVKAAYTVDYGICTDMFNGCTAASATLHTTTANQASWANVMGSEKTWSAWTAAGDWTD